MNKTCSRCREHKSSALFYKKSGGGTASRPECKVCSNKDHADWKRRNKQKRYSYLKKWAELNSDKTKAAGKAYRSSHSTETRIRTAKRRAAKLQASPKWLTVGQLNEIKEFYLLAKELQWLSEEPLEVDHIVPLNGKEVRGLHVPWNLQILPESMNVKKGNRVT